MADDFQIHTPKSKAAQKVFILLFLALLGLFVILFVWKFVSTLWTLKYGDATEKQALSERINPSFSLSPELAALQRAKPSKIEAQKLISSHSPVVGTPEAPVKIIAFIDFECPYSQKSYPIFKQVMEQYEGAAQIVFKHFPIESIHPNAVNAALASTCVQEQGKFWEYYDILFQEKKLDETSLLEAAERVGVNMEKLQECLSSQKYKKDIGEDLQDGIDVGVRGTPTFIIDNKKVEGVIEKNIWDQLIIAALQKSK